MLTLRHLLAILVLPFTVIIVLPLLILSRTNFQMNIGGVQFFLGLLLIALGVTLIVKTISLFATVGQGTLAPWDPPKHFVVRGLYRHVRNPMISGVLCVLLGEAYFFSSFAALLWFLFFLVLNMIYLPLFEERHLEKRFGADYRLYKQNVPRWIPRVTPWTPPFDS